MGGSGEWREISGQWHENSDQWPAANEIQRPEIRLETRRFLGRRPEFLAVCRVVDEIEEAETTVIEKRQNEARAKKARERRTSTMLRNLS